MDEAYLGGPYGHALARRGQYRADARAQRREARGDALVRSFAASCTNASRFRAARRRAFARRASAP